MIGLLLSLTLILGGCGSPERERSSEEGMAAEESLLDPKNPVSVTLWHYYAGENKQALEDAVSRFNQSIGVERGVIISPIAKGSILDLEGEITAAARGEAGSEEMPELFSSYLDKAMEIDALGKLQDLRYYFDGKEKERYFARYIHPSISEEKGFLVFPIVKSTELLYINQEGWDVFAAENGISDEDLRTWEGLLSTAGQYYRWQDGKTPDIPWDGKGLMGLDVLSNFIFVGSRQLGVDIMDKQSGKVHLDIPALRRIYDIYVKGMALGYFDAIGKYRSDNIKSGDLIAYVGSSSGAAYFPSWIEKDGEKQPIRLMAKAYPVFEGGASFIVSQGAGMCLSKSEPKKQEGAVLFLKWFIGGEENARFAVSTGYFPVNAQPYQSGTKEGFLEAMQGDAPLAENLVKVYGVTYDQLMRSDTYETPVFDKSYEIRKFFESTLMMQAQRTEEDALQWKNRNMNEEEILEKLDMDTRFDTWLDELRNELESRDIPYEEVF